MINKLISIIIILILMPLIFLIIIILKFTGEGEIFYLQERVGKSGNRFKIIKFATMLKNSPYMNNGDVTVKNDERVLLVGYYLRKFKINEILQVINVLLGEMSYVGPRPLTPNQVEKVNKNKRKIVEKVLPGITGISSIIFRNEEILFDKKDAKKFHEEITSLKHDLEIWYISKKSLMLDFQIIVFTLISIIFPNLKLYNFFDKFWSNFPKESIEQIFNFND